MTSIFLFIMYIECEINFIIIIKFEYDLLMQQTLIKVRNFVQINA